MERQRCRGSSKKAGNASLRGILAMGALAHLVFAGCLYTGSLSDYVHNGFKVGPNFHPPSAEVETHWIDEGDQRLTSDMPRYDNWWYVFHDPVMSELIATTQSQNLTLQEAGLRVLESRTELGIAVGALFPQEQKAAGDFRHTQISKTTIENRPLIATEVPRAFNRWSAGFDAAWELDVWGKFRRSVESADARLHASVDEYDDLVVTLLAETASAYVELRTVEQRLSYAQRNINAQEGTLAIAESRYKSGETDELDAYQAETNLANTKALIPELEELKRKAEIRLCILMGIPPYDLAPSLGAAPIPQANETVAIGIPADLLRRRPDVRRAEWQVAEQSAKIGVAAADLLPQFTLRGALRYEAKDLDQLLQGSSLAGAISPTFQWDLLNYGRIKNNVLLQDARFQRLLVAYQKTVLEANADVERALVAYLQGQRKVQFLNEAVIANRKALKIALDQYRLGETDYNQIFTLESFLVEEEDALASAQGAVARSLIAIYKALGGGWSVESSGPAHDLVLEPQIEFVEDLPLPQASEDISKEKRNEKSAPPIQDLNRPETGSTRGQEEVKERQRDETLGGSPDNGKETEDDPTSRLLDEDS